MRATTLRSVSELEGAQVKSSLRGGAARYGWSCGRGLVSAIHHSDFADLRGICRETRRVEADAQRTTIQVTTVEGWLLSTKPKHAKLLDNSASQGASAVLQVVRAAGRRRSRAHLRVQDQGFTADLLFQPRRQRATTSAANVFLENGRSCNCVCW